MSTLEPTPERLLLTAILLTMSPKKRARVLAMIGEPTAENVLRFRKPARGTREMNELIRGARQIAGAE